MCTVWEIVFPRDINISSIVRLNKVYLLQKENELSFLFTSLTLLNVFLLSRAVDENVTNTGPEQPFRCLDKFHHFITFHYWNRRIRRHHAIEFSFTSPQNLINATLQDNSCPYHQHSNIPWALQNCFLIRRHLPEGHSQSATHSDLLDEYLVLNWPSSYIFLFLRFGTFDWYGLSVSDVFLFLFLCWNKKPSNWKCCQCCQM